MVVLANHVPGLSYDGMGNAINDGSHTYSYDAEGRPVTVDGVQTTYDAFNRAVLQNRSGAYTEIVYSPSGQKFAFMNGQTVQHYFVPLAGGVQAVYNSSGLQYYRHSDWLGSSRFASTPAGGVYYDAAYSPFGYAYAEKGTTDRSFTGQTQDTVVGDYDFLFRQQIPAQARWQTPDPAGVAAVDFTNPQTWNRYAYLGNNPLNKVDPQGLCTGGSEDPNGGSSTCTMDEEYGPSVLGGLASTWWNATFSAANSTISFAAWDNAYERMTFGDNYYVLPGHANPQAEAEARHLAIITYGWDPIWSLDQKYSWAQGVISNNNTTVNGSTVSDDLALCTAWAESGFDPRASNLGGGGLGAWGLFQTRQPALTDVNKIFNTSYTLPDIHGSANISAYVGTAYLSLAIFTYNGGDVSAGLTSAGPGGAGYAKNIVNCSNSLDAGNGVAAFK